MMKIMATTEDRKEIAKRLAEITGSESRYTRVPRCAYEVGDYVIEKDGSVTIAEGADLQPLRALVEEGMIVPFEPKPISLTVTVPTAGHTGNSLRNLVNLIYTRAGLINKALGTSFAAEQGLIDTLAENENLCITGDFLKAVASYEKEHGQALYGITFTEEKITFFTLPKTDNPDRIKAFTELAGMMNKQALAQKRIQAKKVNDENEKYALRTWLTRLGMNGLEYKTTRRILMENLSGDAAFCTEADKQRWIEKRKA